MNITEIEIENFRNYEKEKVVFDNHVNIIKGDNGQGKTNLLEAIYILSMGKSFRTNLDSEMLGFEKEFFRVRGSFLKMERKLTVEMKMGRRDKSFFIDNIEKKRNAELLEHVYVVVFSPEDLKIVKEDPDKRRRFVDRELFQIKPLYYKELVKYKKVLKNRNNLLKEEEINWDLMGVYDDYLADCGGKIMRNRNEFIKKLNAVSREIEGKITGGKEELEVSYESNLPFFPSPSEQKEHILRSYRENRERDVAHGSTSVGPHKDDIKLTIDGIDLRKYGSQGQQRTAALALKLAELRIIKEETGEDAILLLDDVLSELDYERQNFLIRSFEENQLLITAADLSERTLGGLPVGKVFQVKQGRVTEE